MPTILNQVRASSPVGNGYLVRASDFGVIAPGGNGTTTDGGWSGSNLAYNAGGGSLGATTAHCKISYVTAQGESAPSSDQTVTISAGTGAFTITFPALPSATAGSPELNAAPILGFRVYSASSTATLLNATTDFDATTQGLLKTIATTTATLTNVIPAGTATAQVKVYGTGAVVPVVNFSGVQQPMPVIAASGSSDVFWLVSRTWTPYKMVSWIRPSSSADAGGLMPSLMDCVAPLWVSNTAFSAGALILVNNTVFMCTTAGTTTNGAIPAGLTTRPAKGATVTDSGATWTSQGERDIVRVRFSNTTGSSGQPVSQEYDLLQE